MQGNWAMFFTLKILQAIFAEWRQHCIPKSLDEFVPTVYKGKPLKAIIDKKAYFCFSFHYIQ